MLIFYFLCSWPLEITLTIQSLKLAIYFKGYLPCFIQHSVLFFLAGWVFVAAHGLSLVMAHGGYPSLWCMGFSLWWLLLLRSMGSRCMGSVVVACGLYSTGSVVVVYGLSCSAACGIFPDQGSNLCPLHWQAVSQPLCHQGSPYRAFFTVS